MATQKSNSMTDTINTITDSEEEFADVDWMDAEVIPTLQYVDWMDAEVVPTLQPLDTMSVSTPEDPMQKRQRQLPPPPYLKYKKHPNQVSWNDLPPDEFKVNGWGGYWCDGDGWFIPMHCEIIIAICSVIFIE